MEKTEVMKQLKAMGTAQNRKVYARHGVKGDMYGVSYAISAIGIRNPELEKKAITAAEKIGTVEVDHGAAGCKTPDAAAYIRKTIERKRNKTLRK